MAIEVRIPKEIREYKEKIIFGLNLRQLICVIIGGVVCLGTYFLVKQYVGSDIAGDIIIIEALPIFAFGFIKIKSLDFEKYTKIFLKHKLGTNKRYYETQLEIEKIKIEDKEVKKFESNKNCSEYTERTDKSRNAKVKEIRRRIKRAKKEFKEQAERRKTKELIESREQIQIAKENYKRARKNQYK